MEYKSVRITRNLYEPGDMLLTFYYEISWTAPENQPDEPADEAFIFRLMNADETETLGYSLPYPFLYNGYGEGVGSMYWDAASAPTWEVDRILRIEENPGLDPSPKVVKRSVTTDDYSPYSEQEDNQEYLRAYLIDAAKSLEVAWELETGTLLGADNYLTAAGGSYFEGAILGLRVLCPDIFSIKETVPEYEDREWGTEHQAQAEGQWSGTWIQDSLDGLSGLFGGVGWQMLTSVGCIFAFLGLLAFSHAKFKTTKPGLLLGILPILGGSILGFIPYIAVGLTCFGGIMFLAYTFWFKGAP